MNVHSGFDCLTPHIFSLQPVRSARKSAFLKKNFAGKILVSSYSIIEQILSPGFNRFLHKVRLKSYYRHSGEFDNQVRMHETT